MKQIKSLEKNKIISAVPDFSASNIVQININPKKLPPLSDKEKAQLDALDSITDDQIDYSDAPYLPDAVWTRAEPDFDRELKKSQRIMGSELNTRKANAKERKHKVT